MSQSRLQKRVSRVSESFAQQDTHLPHAAQASRTVSWDDVPIWLRDNKYTITGYRRPTPNYYDILVGLTFLHNQTCNIYTHLIGALLLPLFALAVLQHVQSSQYIGVAHADTRVFTTFFVGGELCLIFSAVFHCLIPHSPAVFDFWHRLDLLGIVVVTVTTFIPGIFYLFYCEPGLQKLHWAIILTSGSATAALICIPKFRTLRWRTTRVSAYVALGLSALIPLLHGIHRYGYDYMAAHSGMTWYVLEGVFYIAGVGLYGSRTPERFSPGRFDIWGSSHQIFHVCILCALYFHTTGLLQAFSACHTVDICEIKRMAMERH